MLDADGQTIAGAAFGALDRMLDAAHTGPLRLKQPEVAGCVSRVLQRPDAKWRLYDVRGWAVMPNHVHALLLPHKCLVRVLQIVKSAGARRANQLLGRTGQKFWLEESCDHWVRNSDQGQRIVRYTSRGIRLGRELWAMLRSGRGKGTAH